jgi:hypothetical protein
VDLQIAEMTLDFRVVGSVAPLTAVPVGVASGDSGGNHVRERKSLPFLDNRFTQPPEFVLHSLRCAASAGRPNTGIDLPRGIWPDLNPLNRKGIERSGPRR